MASPVLDLSHWNPTPDWAKIRQAGVVGVIHKATEGTSYVDDQLFKRGGAAIGAGLLWATYHFLKAGNPEGQMAHYLKTVNPKMGERMCIDHEEKASLSELKAAVKYLRTTRPDVQVAIYSGHLIKEQLGSSTDQYLTDNTSLWLAQYASSPSWPIKVWSQWSLWQYTDSETVPGISSPVDGNKWNGDPSNLPAWFGVSGVPVPTPEPEPEPEVLTVDIDVKAPEGVKVNIQINGQRVTQS